MFRSKSRRKSSKKVTKASKQSDGNSPNVYSSQKAIITSTRKTADLNDVSSKSRSRTDQSRNQHQNKSISVEQNTNTEAISDHLLETNTGNGIPQSNGEVANGFNLNRRTYSLEKVSRSLDEIMASGKAILEALSSTNVKDIDDRSAAESNLVINTSVLNSRIHSNKRQTYDLNKMSDLLDMSVDNGSSLEQRVDDFSPEDCASSSVQRNTYDLETISMELDKSEAGLVEMLHELTLEEAQIDCASRVKRETYDLEVISTTLDHNINSGQNVQDTSEQVSMLKSTLNFEKDTGNRCDLSSQLDYSINTSDHGIDNSDQISDNITAKDVASTPVSLAKRGTYNLTDVSDILDDSVNSGSSIDDSLDQMSSSVPMELKRRTYDLSASNLEQELQLQTSMGENSTETLSVSKNLPMDILNDSTGSMKRNTYVRDDNDNLPSQVDSSNKRVVSKISKNESDYRDNKEPVDGLLSELDLDGVDGTQESSELTPGQWIEQMKELKTPATISPLKLKLNSKKCGAGKKDLNIKTSAQSNKHVDADTKQRSQTISGASSELSSRSLSNMRARSLSDSKVRSQLKSSSSPSIPTSSPSLEKVSHSQSLQDVSPGIQNYLANKLGLSAGQCIAVHRRLSNSSQTASDVSKLANRKTYSLDDVAHSLDIATSQGLPMTKVLDNLDGNADKEESNNDTSLDNQTGENQKADVESSQLDENTDPSAVLHEDVRNTKPETLDLKPNAIGQSNFSANLKTFIKANGSSFVDGSPTGTLPGSLDKQFKMVCKKAVYKPSSKLHSFAHLLGGKGSNAPLRRTRGGRDPLKRNTYTLESVAESLEKAQDAGVPMLDALKRLSGSCQAADSELTKEKRKTYSLEDVSKTLETAAAEGISIADTLRTIADPSALQEQSNDENEAFETPKPQTEIFKKPKPQPKKKPPPKPKRTFSNSSKPEIKFVADSFVIEYYTSPKRSQSESAVEDVKRKTPENFYENQSSVFDAVNNRDEVSVSSSSKEQPGVANIAGEGQKPATKVVSDLDSLLVKLAAEVENPTNPDSCHKELNVDDTSTCSSTDAVSYQDSDTITSANDRQMETRQNEELTSHSFSIKSEEDLHNQKGMNIDDLPAENLEDSNLEFSNNRIDTKSTNTLVNKPDISRSGLFPAEKLERVDLSSESVHANKTGEAVNNSGIGSDILKLGLDEEVGFSNTKNEDEGYCSLSRKLGTKSVDIEHENKVNLDELFEKKKLVSVVEKETAGTKEGETVKIVCWYNEEGETQEGEIKLTAEDELGEKVSETTGEVPKRDTVRKGLVFYSI